MRIVVDTNIIFSAILNIEGKIGQLIINGSKYFDFFSIKQLKDEIEEHRDKILKATQYDYIQYMDIYQLIFNKIRFIDDILISDVELKKSIELVSGIDEDDAVFVALTNHLHSKLWTGDKKLISGLKKKGYNKVITTNELFELYLNKELVDSFEK
jgi:predicted nucleic acid-binding protein